MIPLAQRRVPEHRLVLSDDNPARFLRILLEMASQQNRHEFAFDQQDLEWCSLVWNQAALAALGDEEFLHWRDFYKHHSDALKDGETAHKTQGALWFDKFNEWPGMGVILRAMDALEHAGMAVSAVVRKPSLYRSVS